MKLIGLRSHFNTTIIDPVIPMELDGLKVSLEYLGKRVLFRFSIDGKNSGVKKIEVNGAALSFNRESNPYRRGGAVVHTSELDKALNQPENIVVVLL
jgi:cellobiose phosphorylase